MWCRTLKKTGTFPSRTRPRPPLGDHSSLATRSSLVVREARHTWVTVCPPVKGLVYGRVDRQYSIGVTLRYEGTATYLEPV